MDADGRRFHHILGRADWERCAVDPGGAVEYLAGAEELALTASTPLFPDRPGNRRASVDDRRGVAADAFGDVYWIDPPATGILVQRAGDGSISAFWSSEARPPPRGRAAPAGAFGPAEECPLLEPALLAGLAVTADDYLVAGMVAPPGLAVFDLRAGGPPRRLRWPAAVRFRPFDIAPRPGGGVFVVEREPPRLWILDRRLEAVPVAGREAGPAAPTFVAAVGAPCDEPPAPAATDAVPLGGDPIAVEALPDDTALVLDRSGAAPTVRRFRAGAAAGRAALGGELAIRPQDMAVEPGPHGDRLVVADERGNQAFSFSLEVGDGDLAASPEHRYLPMRSYTGRGLVRTPSGTEYDFDGRWVPLVEQGRHAYRETARVTTVPLDGREPGCVWHRVVLDACLGDGASVAVSSRAADDPSDLAASEWRAEPAPLRRPDGPELPWLEGGEHPSWELLLQGARGRWLQLRLDLSGDRRSTPRVRAVRVWYPRIGYRERYLPAIYGEDGESAAFLDRFLANPEGIATALEDRIAAAEVLFDPRVAPADALDWLSAWVDMALDPSWDEARRRLALRYAVAFWAMRGTLRGLDLTLRLALDPCIDEGDFAPAPPPERRLARIIEAFCTRGLPAVVAGDPTRDDLSGGDPPPGLWRPEDGADALDDRYRAEVGPDRFPLSAPASGAEEWRAFARRAIGFVPAATTADAARWSEFLAGRYRSVEELNGAHGRVPGWASFAAVPLPDHVPGAERAAVDWYQFETIVLTTGRVAHRFTVLLPVSVDAPAEDHERRRRLVERIVRLHAPAHTAFDVRFFWAALRVGQARLGQDTVVDLGMRSPAVLRAAVLGRDHLGEARLAGDQAPRLTRPPTIARDQLVR
jgi:phage tail-like protein